jgi:hypothetical protein
MALKDEAPGELRGHDLQRDRRVYRRTIRVVRLPRADPPIRPLSVFRSEVARFLRPQPLAAPPPRVGADRVGLVAHALLGHQIIRHGGQ